MNLTHSFPFPLSLPYGGMIITQENQSHLLYVADQEGPHPGPGRQGEWQLYPLQLQALRYPRAAEDYPGLAQGVKNKPGPICKDGPGLCFIIAVRPVINSRI